MKIVYKTVDNEIYTLQPVADMPIEDIAQKDVPAGATYVIVNDADVPADWEFMQSWIVDTAMGAVAVDIEKAKSIAHGLRRRFRSEELGPLDVEATIPHLASGAEAKRSAIRAKYASIQSGIDSATSIASIKVELGKAHEAK